MRVVIFILLFLVFSVVGEARTINSGQKASANVLESAEQFEHLIAERKFTEAIEFGLDAFDSAFSSLDKDDTSLVRLGLSLGSELGERGAYREAVGIVRECLNRLERRYGVDSLELVPALTALAALQSSESRLATYQRALGLQKTHMPNDNLAYGKLAIKAGKHLSYHRSNRKEAEKLLREALDIYKSEFGEKSVEIVEPLMLLGGATVEWNSYRKSKRNFDRAINIAKKSGDRHLYATQLRSAGTYLLKSYSSDTGKYLLKAYKEFNKLLGPDHYETGRAQLRLSEFYLKEGKEDKAEPGLLAALELYQDNPDYRNDKLSALSMLVEAYELRGQSEQATQYCKAIGEIQPWNNNQQAQPIYKRQAKYPSTAAKNGYRGYVVTEFTVDENGFVKSPVVVDSEGPGSFEREALRAIEGFRYAPRFENGLPVSTANVRYRINFRLDRRQRGTR